MTNNKKDREIIRDKSKRKSDSFEYCKWAIGDWEARFYANTDAHLEARAEMINQLVTNPAWFRYKPKSVDKRIATRKKTQGKKTQDWIT